MSQFSYAGRKGKLVMEETNVQIGVGYRTCKVCGKTFAKDMQHPKRQKCPECHAKDPHSHNTQANMTKASFAEMKRCEEIAEQKRRERMRKRDAEFERWERENGIRPRFEDHGTCIVEIRGQVCCGCRAVSSVKHT